MIDIKLLVIFWKRKWSWTLGQGLKMLCSARAWFLLHVPAFRLFPSRGVNLYSLVCGLELMISKPFLMLSFFWRFFYHVLGWKDSSSWFSPGQIKVSALHSVWASYLPSCFTYPGFFFTLPLNLSNDSVSWGDKRSFVLRIFWVQQRNSFSFECGFSMNWFFEFNFLFWFIFIFVRLVLHRGLRRVCWFVLCILIRSILVFGSFSIYFVFFMHLKSKIDRRYHFHEVLVSF